MYYCIMKKILIISFVFTNICYSQIKDLAFKNQERCTYKINYGLINAGKAELFIKEKDQYFEIIGRGKSNLFVDLFFKVRDEYKSHIHKKTLLPNYFYRYIIEGNDTIFQEYTFNHKSKMVMTQKGAFDILGNTQDLLSSFFYYRSLNSKTLTKKNSFYVNLFIDEKNYKMNVSYLGNEIIKTPLGNIRCLKFSPKVIVGRMFNHEDDLNIWISDDKNHILVKVEMKILVGSINAKLESVENIKFPLSITD